MVAGRVGAPLDERIAEWPALRLLPGQTTAALGARWKAHTVRHRRSSHQRRFSAGGHAKGNSLYRPERSGEARRTKEAGLKGARAVARAKRATRPPSGSNA